MHTKLQALLKRSKFTVVYSVASKVRRIKKLKKNEDRTTGDKEIKNMYEKTEKNKRRNPIRI